MRRMYKKLPSVATFSRNEAKIAGFATGMAGTLLLGLFMGVVYTGESAFVPTQPDSSPVYPTF